MLRMLKDYETFDGEKDINNPKELKELEEFYFPKIDEFNKNYTESYAKRGLKFNVFVTSEEDNFVKFVQNAIDMENDKNNEGYKETYYFLLDDDTIVSTGSIRIVYSDNFHDDIAGNIQYMTVPTFRGNGYGTLFCHYLIEKLYEKGEKYITIEINGANIGSQKIALNNFGTVVDVIDSDKGYPGGSGKTLVFQVNTKESLEKFDENKYIKRKTR